MHPARRPPTFFEPRTSWHFSVGCVPSYSSYRLVLDIPQKSMCRMPQNTLHVFSALDFTPATGPQANFSCPCDHQDNPSCEKWRCMPWAISVFRRSARVPAISNARRAKESAKSPRMRRPRPGSVSQAFSAASSRPDFRAKASAFIC